MSRFTALHSDFRLNFAYSSEMGGERASTTRRRMSGKICCSCECPLPEPHIRGERYCAKCSPTRRIYMGFQRRDLWDCYFLEADLNTTLPRHASFSDPKDMLDFAQRGGCAMRLEDRQAFEQGVEIGRGGVWLNVTDEQYRRLK